MWILYAEPILFALMFYGVLCTLYLYQHFNIHFQTHTHRPHTAPEHSADDIFWSRANVSMKNLVMIIAKEITVKEIICTHNFTITNNRCFMLVINCTDFRWSRWVCVVNPSRRIKTRLPSALSLYLIWMIFALFF